MLTCLSSLHGLLSYYIFFKYSDLFAETESEYIRNEVFVYLIPALEETLNKAKIWEALVRQKCFFNGIDWIVQVICRKPLGTIVIIHSLKRRHEYLGVSHLVLSGILFNTYLMTSKSSQQHITEYRQGNIISATYHAIAVGPLVIFMEL